MVGTPVRYDHLVVREPGRHGFAALQHCSTAALQQSAAGLAVVARGAVFAQSGTAAKREPSGRRRNPRHQPREGRQYDLTSRRQP